MVTTNKTLAPIAEEILFEKKRLQQKAETAPENNA